MHKVPKQAQARDSGLAEDFAGCTSPLKLLAHFALFLLLSLGFFFPFSGGKNLYLSSRELFPLLLLQLKNMK